MPSGGARSRSGPTKNQGSIRSGRQPDRSGWVDLPVEGRSDPPPAWPLGRSTKFERETWEAEWRRPQALAWERLGWTVQVAIYVRTLEAATKRSATSTTMTNLLRQMVNLGLTEDGMTRNRWRIIEAAPAPAAVRRPAGTSARERLGVIQGGANARAS